MDSIRTVTGLTSEPGRMSSSNDAFLPRCSQDYIIWWRHFRSTSWLYSKPNFRHGRMPGAGINSPIQIWKWFGLTSTSKLGISWVHCRPSHQPVVLAIRQNATCNLPSVSLCESNPIPITYQSLNSHSLTTHGPTETSIGGTNIVHQLTLTEFINHISAMLSGQRNQLSCLCVSK